MVRAGTDVNATELLKKIAEQAEEIKQLKSKKKFGLVWEDKPDSQVLRVRDEAPMLCEDTSRAAVTNQNATNHILINGDNFHALTALRATHTGKVDVIYIDPPYNTGNKDFIYNDDYVSEDDGFLHSKWLSFMSQRLQLSKELLTDSGVAIVAIGNDEIHHLRMLMDEIFEPENFLSQVTWAGDVKNDARFVSNTSDYMLIYANNKQFLSSSGAKFRAKKSGVDEMLEAANSCWSEAQNAPEATKKFRDWLKKQPLDGPVKSQKGNALYNNIDDKGRLFQADNISWPGGGGPKYDVLHPVTGKPVATPSGGWRAIPETMDKWLREDRVVFGKDHSTGVRYKRFLYEVPDMVLRDEFFISRSDANKTLGKILGNNKFPFPKDHNVLAQWIAYVSQNNKNSIVLDFFAGSGTTAHAVASLNREDGGSRQCILVTDGGKTETSGESSKNAKEGAVNIAEEITYERVRRVLTGKDWADGKEHEPLGGNLRYFKVKLEPAPHGVTTRDQRLGLEKYTIEHAKIATNIFNEVASVDELDDETLLPVEYKVFADEVNDRYLVGVNAHDFALAELKAWFSSLPETATVIMVGNGVEEIEWVRKNSDRIIVDDVLGRVIRSRKYVASKLRIN